MAGSAYSYGKANGTPYGADSTKQVIVPIYQGNSSSPVGNVTVTPEEAERLYAQTYLTPEEISRYKASGDIPVTTFTNPNQKNGDENSSQASTWDSKVMGPPYPGNDSVEPEAKKVTFNTPDKPMDPNDFTLGCTINDVKDLGNGLVQYRVNDNGMERVFVIPADKASNYPALGQLSDKDVKQLQILSDWLKSDLDAIAAAKQGKSPEEQAAIDEYLRINNEAKQAMAAGQELTPIQQANLSATNQVIEAQFNSDLAQAIHNENKDETTGLSAGDFLYNTKGAQDYIAQQQAINAAGQEGVAVAQSEEFKNIIGGASAGAYGLGTMPAGDNNDPNIMKNLSGTTSSSWVPGNDWSAKKAAQPTIEEIHNKNMDQATGLSAGDFLYNTQGAQDYVAQQQAAQAAEQAQKDAQIALFNSLTSEQQAYIVGETNRLAARANLESAMANGYSPTPEEIWNTRSEEEKAYIQGVSAQQEQAHQAHIAYMSNPGNYIYNEGMGTDSSGNAQYNPYLDNNPNSAGFYLNL